VLFAACGEDAFAEDALSYERGIRVVLKGEDALSYERGTLEDASTNTTPPSTRWTLLFFITLQPRVE